MKYLILITLFLFGCAYPKKTEYYRNSEKSQDKAVIYIYRSETAIDSFNPDVPSFYVNLEKIGQLSIGGYYKVVVAPGDKVINYKTPLFGIPLIMSFQELKFKAEPNKIYYVKFSIESVMRITKLELVSSEMGDKELQGTRLLVND